MLLCFYPQGGNLQTNVFMYTCICNQISNTCPLFSRLINFMYSGIYQRVFYPYDPTTLFSFFLNGSTTLLYGSNFKLIYNLLNFKLHETIGGSRALVKLKDRARDYFHWDKSGWKLKSHPNIFLVYLLNLFITILIYDTKNKGALKLSSLLSG